MLKQSKEISEKADELLALTAGNEDFAIEAIRSRCPERKVRPQNIHLNISGGANAVISTIDLTKTYHLGNKVVTALDKISISIGRGEFVAITGASGSGKSTLLQLMGGLDKPSSGQVIIGDKDLSKLNDKQLSTFRNKTIGFIFQFFYLQPFLTLSKNIEIPCMPSGMKPDLRKIRTTTLLEAVGLHDLGGNRPDQLSGGQIQRAAIARALYNNPDIILADEPTGNLDSINSKLIVDLLTSIRAQFNTTIVIVTHDDKIAAQADRVIILKDGKLV